MSAPNINLYVGGGGSVVTSHSFNPRPLGGKTNPYEIDVWNDKPTDVTGEAVGTGDGTTDTFTLDNENIVSGSATVYVDGVSAAGNYSLTLATGEIVFNSGSIPALDEAITADYSYGTGAAGTTAVYAICRRRHNNTGDGTKTDYVLPTTPTAVYSAEVDGAEVAFTSSGSTVSFDSAPAMSAAIVIYYEDEGIQKQSFQVKSSGVEDPHSTGIVDDAESAYTPIGGTESVTGETPTGGPTVFSLAYAPVVPASAVVYEDGSAVSGWTLDYLLGTIEFTSDPSGDVTVDYDYYKGHELGDIPVASARKIQVRGSVATDFSGSLAVADLEIVSV
jgi:hypothetical protein